LGTSDNDQLIAEVAMDQENYKEAHILDQDKEVLSDSLENLIAQLGTSQDKRSHSRFVNSKRLSIDGMQEELNAMYRTDWLAGKVVDIIPDDMTREWRYFSGDIEPETVELLIEEEERLGLSDSFNKAHKWARLYGTAFIVMNIDDGQPVDQPLKINSIKKGGLKHIKVVDRHRIDRSDLQPIENPLDPNYGMPQYYRFVNTNVRIHHSRLIRFDGVQLPFDEFKRNNYMSDSVLDRLYEALTNFNTVAAGSASMVYETNVDVMKIKGLMNYLQSPEGTSLIQKRFTLAGMLKSFNNMLLLDAEEDYDKKQNTFAGIPDLLNAHALFLAGASDIPATRLLGSSASGLNATGEGDMKNYYDTVRSKQANDYKPKLDILDVIMGKNLGLPDDLDLSYKFNSLFQMTPKEQADTDYINAQRDQIYLDKGVVPEYSIAKDLKQNSTYTNLTDEFIEELEEFDNGFDLSEGIEEGGEPKQAGEETMPEDPSNSMPTSEFNVDPQESLNGAQVTALLEIISRTRTGEINRATAEKVIATSFPISEEAAKALVSEVQEGEIMPEPSEELAPNKPGSNKDKDEEEV